MPEQLNITNIPSARVEIIDSRTGMISREWYRFFLNLFNLAGNGGNQISLDDLQIGPPSADTTGSGGGTGTVTSVAMTVPTGLSVAGSPITTSGTLAVTYGAGYAIPTTASQTQWDTAYSERQQWDGGATNLVAATGRTSLGATTVGGNFFTLPNPSAITFVRINADNTVSTLDAATFRTAIGAGTGSGTVTAVSVVSANGFAGSSSGGATPALTLSTSITGVLKGNGTAISAATSGTDYSAGTSALATGILKSTTTTGALSIAVAADFPTLNQNTTGSAATLTTGRTIAITGDLAYTSPSFDGSTNVTAAGTLATVNATTGSFTNASITVNGKGLVTAASSGTAPVTSVTGTSPVVSSGGATPAISLATAYGDTLNPYASKTANFVLAAPDGAAGVPVFRAVVANDIPTLNQNTTGSAATLTTPRAIYGNNFNGSAALTQIIASTYGGTGNGFTKFSGATTAEKTYSLPDATTTILTTNAAVTIAQGGTGQITAAAAFNALSPVTSTGDLIIGNGTNSATRLAIGANNYVLTSNGTTATWAVATGSGATITNDTTTASNLYPLFAAATTGALANVYTGNANYLYKPSTGELTAIAHVSSNGIQVNATTVATSYTIATGNNGLSAGPVSVNSGISVTVSSGSIWSVV
jgi:hypothetical protein